MNLLMNVNKATAALQNIQNHKNQVLQTLRRYLPWHKKGGTNRLVSAEEQAAGLQEIVMACEKLNTLSSSSDEVLKKKKFHTIDSLKGCCMLWSKTAGYAPALFFISYSLNPYL